MNNFVLNNLSKVNTKRLLAYYKTVRAKLHNLVCSCCHEIQPEDKAKAEKIEQEMEILKAELKTREHIK